MLKRILALFLMIAGATLWAPTAAHAASASLSMAPGVLWDGCRYYPFTLTIDMQEAGSYSADVTIYDARGDVSAGDFLFGDVAAGVSRVPGRVYLCGGEPAGTWRLVADVEYHDTEYYQIGTSTVSTAVALRHPNSRTTLRVNDRTANYGQRITFRSIVAVEKPNRTYVACQYCTTAIQQRTSTGWKTIAYGYTNEYGVLRKTIKWNLRGTRSRVYRAVTPKGDNYRPSVSANLRVY